MIKWKVILYQQLTATSYNYMAYMWGSGNSGIEWICCRAGIWDRRTEKTDVTYIHRNMWINKNISTSTFIYTWISRYLYYSVRITTSYVLVWVSLGRLVLRVSFWHVRLFLFLLHRQRPGWYRASQICHGIRVRCISEQRVSGRIFL